MLSFELATPQEINQALGSRLKLRRLAQNLQQSEVALRAGVSEGTVRNLESKGQATLESFVKIVSALGAAGELASLFERQPTSIAEMERAEVTRQRASRKIP